MFKRTAVLAVILAAAFLVVPLASDAESATPEDIVITLPGSASGDHLSMEIGSGGSDSFIIYVYNTSDCYLSLTVDAEGSSDSVDVTATSNKDMLMPDRLTDSGQVAMRMNCPAHFCAEAEASLSCCIVIYFATPS